MNATQRIFNFSAGPAILPEEVLREAQDNLLSLKTPEGPCGMGIMEISHRSRLFEPILAEAEANLKTLLGLSAGHRVLFLSGGATTQFCMVPLNLLGPLAQAQTESALADYVITGEWAKKALVEAQRFYKVHVAKSTEDENFRRIPRNDELNKTPKAAYLHTTSNNTIWGTQWHWEPDGGAAPIVCDMSSDFLSRPIDVARYGLIYAGAQKNAGPAGVTMVILRPDIAQSLAVPRKDLPIVMSYKTHIDGGSMYNTPPVFPIFVVHLVLRWLLRRGGLSAIAQHNQQKAALIYDAIDKSSGFYRGFAERDSRSLMNITFRLPSEELDKRFVKEAALAEMDGLKGHRTAGGIRASVYNAFPLAGAEALASFMAEFQRKNG